MLNFISFWYQIDVLYLMGILDEWCLYLYQVRFQEPFVFQLWIPNLFLSLWWMKILLNVAETNWLTLLISPRAQLKTWAKILPSGFEFLPSFSSAFYSVGFFSSRSSKFISQKQFQGKDSLLSRFETCCSNWLNVNLMLSPANPVVEQCKILNISA